MDQIKILEREIETIKERNKKVEADKAWETSAFRMVFIIVLTYVFTSIVFYFIGVQNYLTNAFIPTLGYFLSTLSIPFVKKRWISKNCN